MGENRRDIGSDLPRIDAYAVGPADLAEVPELDQAWFDRAQPHRAGRPASRGRPRTAEPKQPVNLRLSPKVVASFRAGGPGWQTRINAVLEKWVAEHPAGI